MTYQYFHIFGVLSRVSIDENSDPNYCETYNSKQNKFIRNNSILEDLFNHSDSIEISEEDFEIRLKKLKQKT